MKKNKNALFSAALLGLAGILVACSSSTSGLQASGDWTTIEKTYLTETTIGTKKTVEADKLSAYSESNPLRIALVTDSGTLDDHSFNESAWKGVNEFAVTNGGGQLDNKQVNTGKIQTRYFQPSGDFTTATRLAAMRSAVKDFGANVLVLPGFLFQGAIKEAIADKTFENTCILALDCVQEDDEYKPYDYNDKVTSVIYREEQAGYLAGYGAVKDGLRKLGFIGGMAVPAVVRYGSGYVQGAAAAAEELKVTLPVEINYYYAGKFEATTEATTNATAWYNNGTEAIFACGGAVYKSVTTAAEGNANAKWIGVDVNQHADTTLEAARDQLLTSAMKNLQDSVEVMLTSYVDNGGAWKQEYAAKVLTVGASSEMCKLPTPTADADDGCWGFKSFKVEDYEALYAGLKDGTVKVNSYSDNVKLSTNNFGVNPSYAVVNYIA